jgi:hypothetical protein
MLSEKRVMIVNSFEKESEIFSEFGLHYLNDVNQFKLFLSDDDFRHNRMFYIKKYSS